MTNVKTMADKENKCRYALLDSIRGSVLISMILFHSCWDLVYIFGKDWRWYSGTGAYIWQQSICWTFIALSGFCWSLGKKPGKRGLVVFLAGMAVSLVTIIFMPENRVVFGVLTLIGSCMLVFVFLDKAFRLIPSGIGLAVSWSLFFLTRNVNEGYLGFEGLKLLKLPGGLYKGVIMTFLGFPAPGFYSTDYFSFFPWVFLFMAGYFLYRLVSGLSGGKVMKRYFLKGAGPLSFLGRHSLIIYMLHQPVIYGLLFIADSVGII